MTKHVINTPERLVEESLEGLCYAYPHLRLLKKEKVVYYANADKMASKQVTLVSGGGSGHEPGYAGMVGEGGLAANVCGHVFASPSASQVMAAIERVQSPHGTLVIVMNYTGDCLNFGLAVERAKARGIKVDLISVGDDVAVGRAKGGKVGRRGMAATTLAIKLAGALAARGAPLDQVRHMVEYAVKHSATIGVAFDHCHIPGSTSWSQLGPDELELGMGIHNETGHLKTKMMPARDMVTQMMTMLTDESDSDRSYLTLPKGASVVILVNNLGGIPLIELNLAAKEAVNFVLAYGLKIERVYVGTFVTSLNMPGFSISLMTVHDKILDLLDQQVEFSGWPQAAAQTFVARIEEEKIEAERNDLLVSECGQLIEPKILETAIRGAAEAVIKAEPEITRYDTALGDAILDRLSSYPLHSTADTIFAIADTIETSVGGTSSAIYCIFLNALASGLVKYSASAFPLIPASQYALNTLMTYTKARVGDRTLMDTLCPFIDVLNDRSLVEAVKLAQQGAESTRHMAARLGRSSYLSNEQVLGSNVPDAGAYGLAELLRGMTKALINK
ncbi:hypothetical protein RMATCC62417_09417 [Rhizopus microsporus]|nr:hypothetical protein RMATCC62417_09417 [Rhizopus microsporus]